MCNVFTTSSSYIWWNQSNFLYPSKDYQILLLGVVKTLPYMSQNFLKIFFGSCLSQKQQETFLERAHTTKTRNYKPVWKTMSNTHFLYIPLYTLKGYLNVHFSNFYGLPRNNKNIYSHLCNLRSTLKWFSKRSATLLSCFRKHFETVVITLKSVEVSIPIPMVFWYITPKMTKYRFGLQKGVKIKIWKVRSIRDPNIAYSFIYPNVVQMSGAYL